MLAVYNPAQDIQPHYKNISHTYSPYQYNFDSLPNFPNNNQSSLLQPRNQLMPGQTQQLHNPPIRVQNSSPLSEGERSARQQMLAHGQYLGNNWGSSAILLSPYQQNGLPQRFNDTYHKRASSASSVASAGPPSPQDSTTAFPHIANSDLSGYSPSGFDSLEFLATRGARMSGKSLPTPVDTPTQNTFSPADYEQFSSPHNVHNQNSLRRIHQDNRSQHDDEVASFAYSGPQSVSSVSQRDSPATPQTAFDGDFDEGAKNLQHTNFNPQLNMTPGMPSVSLDEYYNGNQLQNIPPQQQQQQQQMMARAGGVSPYRTSLANRLQAAQLDHVSSRTSSPVTSIQRERSPFRQESSLYSQASPVSPMGAQRLGPPQMTPAQYQHQQTLNNASIMARQQQQQQQAAGAPATVSPKDVELEYHEEDQTPLFPSSQASHFSLPREESNFSTTSAFGQPNQYYTTVASQQGHSYPFLNQQSSQHGSMRSNADQSLPDFPAHLSSMETTVSSDGQEQPTPAPALKSQPISRPRDTSADVGTYTCTFHNCNQRFDSAARLQRHKRELHRQQSPSAPTTPVHHSHLSANHGHTASAETIAMRNSQQGPHKCDRINPTTGKPCNSVFSRPYDLTRHEDTIHNDRKMKVRCHLCVEEKTFSRSDALTRHMRVVHPEVDWPGKIKRKGRD